MILTTPVNPHRFLTFLKGLFPLWDPLSSPSEQCYSRPSSAGYPLYYLGSSTFLTFLRLICSRVWNRCFCALLRVLGIT